MTGKEFQQEIQSNPKNIYCLVSTDSGIIDLYIKRFREAIHADRTVYGEVYAGINLLKQKVLSVLYIPEVKEQDFEYSEYVFIHTDSIDKRSSVYKKNKDKFIEVENNYERYVIQNGVPEAEAKDFVKKCNNDWGTIKHSLLIYQNGGQIPDYSNDVYLWVNQFIKGEPLTQITESPIGVLALLSHTCQNILNIKANKTEGMNPYAVTKTSELIPYRTDDELRKIISTVFWLDCQVKRGNIDINYTLDYIKLVGRRANNAVTDSVSS